MRSSHRFRLETKMQSAWNCVFGQWSLASGVREIPTCSGARYPLLSQTGV